MQKFLIAFLLFPISAFAESVVMSDRQSLQIADAVAQAGDLDSAEKIYTIMLSSGDIDIRTESVFQMANIAVAKGDFDTAIRYYLILLESKPGLTRVRLELARAYFTDGNYSAAEFHFQLVRATPDLPPEVAMRVDEFLSAIRQKKNWTLDAGFGIVPDSNLNYASGNRQECINTDFGPLCRPLEEKSSGVGFRFYTEGNYYLRFTKRFGLRTTLGLSALDFPKSDFDDYSLNFATGPRYTFDRGEISLQPNVSARWDQGRHYSDSYGAAFDTNWQLSGRWLLGGRLSYRTTKYVDDYIAGILGNVEDYGISLRPRYYINNKSYLIAGVGFDRSIAKADYYSTDSINYSFGYYGEFGWGLTLFTQLGLSDSIYKGPRWFVMQDGGTEQKIRSDLVWQYYVRVSHRSLEFMNMMPALSYTYINRDSNIWSNDFDKHRVEMEIVSRF
ncbi:hypothetical protein AGMMS50222_03890 [Endomicrobiia bacterium]|nr:hypothetical protein AGMMS50222_03890 [Endomicrobiia bacterium]